MFKLAQKAWLIFLAGSPIILALFFGMVESSSHGAPKDFGLGLFLGLLFAVVAFIYMLPTYIASR